MGWCDVCLRVKNAGESRSFYETLGFRRVEGDDSQGWAVMTNDEVRLGLYEAQHVGEDSVTLNFRGGDVLANVEAIRAKGLNPSKGPQTTADGGASAWFKDPDGYTIFLDTAPGEQKAE